MSGPEGGGTRRNHGFPRVEMGQGKMPNLQSIAAAQRRR
jgi:hypothetical protein